MAFLLVQLTLSFVEFEIIGFQVYCCAKALCSAQIHYFVIFSGDVTTFHDSRLGEVWRRINWTLFVGKDTATGHAIRNLTIFQHVQTERPSFYTTLCDYCDGVQVAFQSSDYLTALGVTSLSAPQSLPLFGWHFPERA